MKINNFINVGIAAVASILPSVSNAMTAVHMATVTLASKSPVAAQVVEAVRPENMGAISSFIYDNPAITIGGFGALAIAGTLGPLVWALERNASDYSSRLIEKPKEPALFSKMKSSIGDKMDAILSKHKDDIVEIKAEPKNKM